MTNLYDLFDPDTDPAVQARGLMTLYDRSAQERDEWLSLWQECYELTIPEQARFTGIGSSPIKARARLFDGTAADAVDQLAASLLGQLTPPWVNWFGLVPGPAVDHDLIADVTDILTRSTQVAQDQIDRSNLYTELHQSFLDLVIGGTACLYLYTLPAGHPVRFAVQAVPLSDLVLAGDSAGRVQAIFRPRRVTQDDMQLLRPWLTPEGYQLTSVQGDETFDIIEFCIELGQDVMLGAIANGPAGDPVVVYLHRAASSPYIVFRWQRTPGCVWGRSPVMKALPDIKTANTVVELILKNASIAVTGMWQADDDGVLNPANIQLVPGAIIPKAMGSAGLKPLEMPGRFDVSQLVLEDLRARIRQALLVDRFTPVTAARLTATEVQARSDDTTLILGAIYGRLQSELLTPLLTRVIDMLRGQGEIADWPLDGRSVMLSYQSPLARAQAVRGLQNVAVWLDAITQMGEGARQIVNHDATARFLADTLGIAPSLINPQINQQLIPNSFTTQTGA